MPDYVLYHNPERMGYTADSVGEEFFVVLTDKNLPEVVGSRVWLITGEGNPRTYKLFGYFTPTSRREIDDPDFAFEIRGPKSSGVQLRRNRWPVLNHFPWWKDFLHSEGNFGLGLHVIQPEFVPKLEAVLKGILKYNAK